MFPTCRARSRGKSGAGTARFLASLQGTSICRLHAGSHPVHVPGGQRPTPLFTGKTAVVTRGPIPWAPSRRSPDTSLLTGRAVRQHLSAVASCPRHSPQASRPRKPPCPQGVKAGAGREQTLFFPGRQRNSRRFEHLSPGAQPPSVLCWSLLSGQHVRRHETRTGHALAPSRLF